VHGRNIRLKVGVLSLERKAKALGVVTAIIFNVLGVWIMWEAVVKPLKSAAPNAWNYNFPSPFYIFVAPIWFWHDLAILLIILGTAVLAYITIADANDRIKRIRERYGL
jgi:hypothetical protein